MEKNTDVIQVLKKDHEVVRKMLDELAETSNRASKKRHELLEKVSKELEIHTRVEEEILYPAMKEAGGKQEINRMYFEAIEEHRAVEKLVIPDLEKTEVETDQFAGRVKVLKELVEHHVDEEESEMFPKIQAMFSKDELSELGQKVLDRRQQLH